jgi:gliding motility-associated-like protein
MPSAFTPDGDGTNDEFGPVFRGVDANYKFNIYDRWGQLIFQKDENNVLWNGQHLNSGEMCGEGVYVWKIELQDIFNQKAREYVGNVTLVR